MRSFAPAILFASLVVSGFGTGWAENWSNWRGPAADGVAPPGKYPTEWNAADNKNIARKVSLPGPSGATPAIWDDKIFVTSGNAGKNTAICFDRQGKQLWTVSLGSEVPGKHKKASGSNPSPITDGEHVFVYFKSGDLACLDFSGKIVWQHNLQQEFGEDTLWWDLGTSPVLTENYVVIAVIQSDNSYLAAYDKASGKLAWKHDRNLNAPDEANQSYSTPVVVRDGDRETLVVPGADHVTAHDAASGEEIWRVGGLNPTGQRYFRSIASPVVSEGIVVAPYARGETLTAIKLGGQGDVTKSHVLWESDAFSADVPTPAAAGGRLYVCTDKGAMACLDIKTGAVIWDGDLPRNRNAYSSSPILADGKLYATREDGVTYVVDAEKFKVLAENSLDDFTVTTPVFVDGKIHLRTAGALFCIGK